LLFGVILSSCCAIAFNFAVSKYIVFPSKRVKT
jgi:hypothetical protein